jgi:hypothetical protein
MTGFIRLHDESIVPTSAIKSICGSGGTVIRLVGRGGCCAGVGVSKMDVVVAIRKAERTGRVVRLRPGLAEKEKKRRG